MAEVKEEKKRHRSPAYPAVGLREAVDRVEKFYRTDHKAGAPPEISVKHMGFATAHGQAMAVLAALRKFGLVAEANGRVVPTQRAIEIIELPETDPRRIQALKDAAISPAIYQELIEQHRETGWPADDVLKAELITYKNFNPNAVDGFVKDLRDTLAFAGLSDLSALDSNAEEVAAMTQTESSQSRDLNPTDRVPLQDSVSIAHAPGRAATGKTQALINAWTLSPQATAELRINGEVTTEDLELLRDYVEITIKALSRKTKQTNGEV
jgi:hypothetical protein